MKTTEMIIKKNIKNINTTENTRSFFIGINNLSKDIWGNPNVSGMKLGIDTKNTPNDSTIPQTIPKIYNS